jgi:hypothetical protein
MERERERERERETNNKRIYILNFLVIGTLPGLLQNHLSTLTILRVHASSQTIFSTSTQMTLPMKSICCGSWTTIFTAANIFVKCVQNFTKVWV